MINPTMTSDMTGSLWKYADQNFSESAVAEAQGWLWHCRYDVYSSKKSRFDQITRRLIPIAFRKTLEHD